MNILFEKAKKLINQHRYREFLYKLIDFIILHIININWYLFGRNDMLRAIKDDNRFNISDKALTDVLNRFPIKKYEVEKIKLGSIRYNWQGQLYSINETATYDYISNNNLERYINYIKIVKTDSFGRINKQISDIITKDLSNCRNTIDTILTKGYDVQKSIVIINDRNVLVDGLHRISILFKIFGPEYEIAVLKLYYKRILS